MEANRKSPLDASTALINALHPSIFTRTTSSNVSHALSATSLESSNPAPWTMPVIGLERDALGMKEPQHRLHRLNDRNAIARPSICEEFSNISTSGELLPGFVPFNHGDLTRG